MAKHTGNSPSKNALDKIKGIVGPAGWSSVQDGARYFDDPRGRFAGKGCLIVTPTSTAQVAEIVALCNTHAIAIVPYSGGTGVVAGQLWLADDSALILSLEKMNAIRDISVDEGVMVAEAGCILENIHSAAAAQELIFPLSMASKGSCCIGGNLATNAGGIQVLRYGNARDLCCGIEAVLPDGSVLNELTPLRKNNTGYDLRHLLIGSEGTLGIITAASLMLKPRDPETVTAMLAMRTPGDGLAVYRALKAQLGEQTSALELMSGFGLDLVVRHFPALRPPFGDTPDWALLVEVSGAIGIGEKLEATLQALFEQDILVDAVIAQSEGQQKDLWDFRENTPQANRMAGAFCNSDTAVPIGKVDGFIKDTQAAIGRIHRELEINSYGHIGDGNIHHNVFPPQGVGKTDFLAANPGIIDAVRIAINDVTHAHGGSISAEHGIGRLKTDDLERYTSSARLETLRRIKSALDPNGIMNPGALVR